MIIILVVDDPHQSDVDNLKLVIDGHIGLVVPVHQFDVKAVVVFGGELVQIFKTKPALAWNNISL